MEKKPVANPEFSYGNHMQTSIKDITKSFMLQYFTDRIPDRIGVYSGFDVNYVCFSGFLYAAFFQNETIYSPDRICETSKALYSHINTRSKLIWSNYSKFRIKMVNEKSVNGFGNLLNSVCLKTNIESME